MVINEVLQNKGFLPLIQQNDNSAPSEGAGSFSDALQSFVGDVNSVQKESAHLTEKFIKGDPVDIHDVMIAGEKAKTSFELLMEMRNKFLDMYREVLRMQI